jgi:hypothetical protein
LGTKGETAGGFDFTNPLELLLLVARLRASKVSIRGVVGSELDSLSVEIPPAIAKELACLCGDVA